MQANSVGLGFGSIGGAEPLGTQAREDLTMSEENKALVGRLYAEVFGAGSMACIDELVDVDVVEHEEMPGIPPGREGLKMFVGMMRTAFPDLQFRVGDMIADGDIVAARITMEGTHQGEFMGIPATGKTISVEAMDFLRVANGKLVEHWGVTDQMAMMQQLGAMPD